MVKTTPYQPISLAFVQKDRYCSGNTHPKQPGSPLRAERIYGGAVLRVTRMASYGSESP